MNSEKNARNSTKRCKTRVKNSSRILLNPWGSRAQGGSVLCQVLSLKHPISPLNENITQTYLFSYEKCSFCVFQPCLYSEKLLCHCVAFCTQTSLFLAVYRAVLAALAQGYWGSLTWREIRVSEVTGMCCGIYLFCFPKHREFKIDIVELKMCIVKLFSQSIWTGHFWKKEGNKSRGL